MEVVVVVLVLVVWLGGEKKYILVMEGYQIQGLRASDVVASDPGVGGYWPSDSYPHCRSPA
jgi:hypothetical protein